MGIAGLYLTSKESYISYADYAAQYAGKPKVDGGIAYNIQAEGGQSQYLEK